MAGRAAAHVSDLIDQAEKAWALDDDVTNARINALSTRILEVARSVERSFEVQCRARGLNTGELLVLDALHRLGLPFEATPSQLRQHFFISFAGIGKRVNALEALGYVERNQQVTDRRSQKIRLTPDGLAILRAFEGRQHRVPHRVAIASMESAEQEMLAMLLRKLHRQIETITATMPDSTAQS
ncbi:MarR family transcriptional regulator [Sphingobium sp. HBC34]|uniref:MarR family transcriptional regulator n=1 Tax=Sphingobium cyanobacteriorum TaxID=3063954 RepID=A0ABT8ZRE2_9SPHN|nr:MarR family transcriptional regulator [Sphingobium sp. HBC34]MDO7836766.1 MarR family transcriptional regulator [Sphingobium sp. HBC34]